MVKKFVSLSRLLLSGFRTSAKADSLGARDRDNESGQALVFVALSMAVIMGFMALAIDVGVLFRARRNLQIATDSAATAAALNYLYYGSVSTAKTAGINAAAANGVTITASNINTPPLSGPYSATTAGSYFEVLPNQPTGTFFMGVISHTNSVTVGARAVAGTPSASKACVFIGNATARDAFHIQGSGNLTTNGGCGVYVNSSDTQAVKVTGNPTLSAAYFDIVGGYSGHATTPTAPTPNSPPQSDPLGNIPGPNPNPPSTDCTAANTVTVSTVTSSTAIPVINGITCFSHANVTLSGGITLPGGAVYVFENSVTIGGTMTVGSSTNGATLDIYQGTFTQNNSTLSVFAPTSGTYNGIAIMQPSGNANQLQVQFGSGNQTLDGMIYAPAAEVFLQDNGGGVTATGVVADTMFLKSSSLTINSYSAAHPTTTPLKAVTLVE
jgi:Flp pilus assembly protein TadG